MVVIGIENVDYVSKKTGERVYGKKLHLSAPISSEKGFGDSAENVYCRKNIADNVALGDTVRLYYDKFGNVETVIIDK